ncbi:MAG: LD-carboxypeptidase [Bacteroidales bacterium]|nr:LD-carboxypeptidase [Bacteroidales bacterium]
MTSRRTFIKKTGALAAVTAASVSGLRAAFPEPGSMVLKNQTGTIPPRILPKRLSKGDLIGLVTPGSSVSQEELADCISKLEGLGFRTTYNDTVLSEYGYFAGPDQERADELMEMFAREDVDGIWCVRGGYGSIRILDLLDYEKIGQNPKVLIGYSDITAIITSVFQETGLVTFHGPVGTSDFNRFSKKSIRKVVMEPGEQYKYPYNREKETRENPEYDRYTITGGEAEGELIGGNISVLDSIIGTRFEPNFENKLVYLEDVGEKTYRVDKMVYHLLSGTNLKRAAGIVMGAFDECNINEEPTLSLRTALDDLLKPLGIPVSYGLSFGHIKRMVTVPTGIRAAMDADKNSFRLLEPAVT